MIKVICYCGCAYSFAGDVGSCPQCGEHVFFAHGPAAEAQNREETIAKVVARVSGGSHPDEKAA